MKELLAVTLTVALCVLTVGSYANAEQVPLSLEGYETSGGEYSKIYMQWEGLTLVDASITLPDKNWNEIVIPLDITRYSQNDDTFTLTSIINQQSSIVLSGTYIDEKVVLIDGRLSYHDEDARTAIDQMDIMKLEYVATVETIEYDTVPEIELKVDLKDTQLLDLPFSMNVESFVKGSNFDEELDGVNLTYTITRHNIPVWSQNAVTGTDHRDSIEITLESAIFDAVCYDMVIFAEKDGKTTMYKEDFLIVEIFDSYHTVVTDESNCNRF